MAIVKVRKAIPKVLKDALAQAASAAAVTAPSFAKGDGKAFEAWLLFETAVALKPKHNVLPVDHTGRPTSVFRVRGGPGYLPLPTSSTGSEPCHFHVSGRGPVMELHSGLRHLGDSGADHELDISIIFEADARNYRVQGVSEAFRGLPWVGFELKDYDPGAYLPKGFARSLIGVGMEIYPFNMLASLKVEVSGRMVLGYNRDPRARLSLITSARLRPSSCQMLQHYGIGWKEQLMPGALISAQYALRIALGI